MKSMIYSNAGQLITDLNRAKSMCRGGTATVLGKKMTDVEIMDRMIELAPGIFKYRDELLKAGVGTTKALLRFCDLAGSNLKEIADEQYLKDLKAIEEEAAHYEEAGVADDIVSTLVSAQWAISQHNQAAFVINGFGKKLNEIMEKIVIKLKKVTEVHADMVLKARKNAKLLSLNSEAIELLKKSEEIIRTNEKSMEALVPLMTEYCALNVGIISIMRGYSMPGNNKTTRSVPAVVRSSKKALASIPEVEFEEEEEV
jgi:hypothetical protein